jgi:type II secretory pathway pseudopilin PulG
MIEMVFAIVIGTILTGIALTSFRTAQSRFAASSAKGVYATLHQRARSKSVELGETVILWVDVAGDSAYLGTLSEGRTDVTRFGSELNVDLRSRFALFRICMTPRGYADYDCGFFSNLPGFTATSADTIRLEFWQSSDSSSVLILPMGQLVGM